MICQNRHGPRNPQAGGYGKTRLGPIYVAGAFAFTNNWFNTNHFVLGDQITAKFNGQRSAGAWKVVIATSQKREILRQQMSVHGPKMG